MNNEIFFSIFSLAHRSATLDWLIVFSANGFGYLMIVLAVLFLYAHHDTEFSYTKPFVNFTRKAREIALVFSSGFIAWGLASIIKNYIVTPRPFIAIPEITPLFYHGGMDSFPSGHSTFFFALATALFLSHRPIGVWYGIVALIVCFGRVAGGVHFPIDILGGAVLGVSIALILNIILRPRMK